MLLYIHPHKQSLCLKQSLFTPHVYTMDCVPLLCEFLRVLQTSPYHHREKWCVSLSHKQHSGFVSGISQGSICHRTYVHPVYQEYSASCMFITPRVHTRFLTAHPVPPHISLGTGGVTVTLAGAQSPQSSLNTWRDVGNVRGMQL